MADRHHHRCPGRRSRIGGREITQLNQIEKYNGPGTYGTDKLNSVAGALYIDIDNTPYQAADASTAQVVSNADGSGSFTFTGLEEGEQGNPGTPKGAISGMFTWTCSD